VPITTWRSVLSAKKEKTCAQIVTVYGG
jgi:hypothetical protein